MNRRFIFKTIAAALAGAPAVKAVTKPNPLQLSPAVYEGGFKWVVSSNMPVWNWSKERGWYQMDKPE